MEVGFLAIYMVFWAAPSREMFSVESQDKLLHGGTYSHVIGGSLKAQTEGKEARWHNQGGIYI